VNCDEHPDLKDPATKKSFLQSFQEMSVKEEQANRGIIPCEWDSVNQRFNERGVGLRFPLKVTTSGDPDHVMFANTMGVANEDSSSYGWSHHRLNSDLLMTPIEFKKGKRQYLVKQQRDLFTRMCAMSCDYDAKGDVSNHQIDLNHKYTKPLLTLLDEIDSKQTRTNNFFLPQRGEEREQYRKDAAHVDVLGRMEYWRTQLRKGGSEAAFKTIEGQSADAKKATTDKAAAAKEKEAKRVNDYIKNVEGRRKGSLKFVTEILWGSIQIRRDELGRTGEKKAKVKKSGAKKTKKSKKDKEKKEKGEKGDKKEKKLKKSKKAKKDKKKS
jgi:hypothetical protein